MDNTQIENIYTCKVSHNKSLNINVSMDDIITQIEDLEDLICWNKSFNISVHDTITQLTDKEKYIYYTYINNGG